MGLLQLACIPYTHYLGAYPPGQNTRVLGAHRQIPSTWSEQAVSHHFTTEKQRKVKYSNQQIRLPKYENNQRYTRYWIPVSQGKEHALALAGTNIIHVILFTADFLVLYAWRLSPVKIISSPTCSQTIVRE